MLGTGSGMLNKTDKLSILSWNLHSRQVANIDQMYHYKFDGYYKGEEETSITTLFVSIVQCLEVITYKGQEEATATF